MYFRSLCEQVQRNLFKIVCDQEEEGTDNHGRLKKVVEVGAMATKSKKKNVKYTEQKATAMTSKSIEKATSSYEDESGDESCTSGEEQFSTSTSFDRHKQYKPLDKTRKEARFGAKKRDAAAEDSIQFTMRTLKDQFSNVMKKLSEQEKTIKNLKLSNAIQK